MNGLLRASKHCEQLNKESIWHATNGQAERGKFPLSGLVFYAPLYHQKLNTSPFLAWDVANGTTHSCTVTGATHGSTGRTFDGAEDTITIPHATSLNFSTGITLESWIYPTVIPAAGSIIAKYAEPNYWYLRIISATSTVRVSFDHDVTSLIGTTNAILVNNWYHIVVTWNGATITLYINGVFNKSVAFSGSFNNNSANIEIGTLNGTIQDFTGIIGEVRVYNRALTLAEINHHYLVSKWRFQ